MTRRELFAGIAAIAVMATILVSGAIVLHGAIGYLDPWFYTGYIQSYDELLERFGRTYYSTRVGALWPSAILYEGLGDAAYTVSRWLTLFAIGMGTALFLRRLGKPIIAFAGGCALMTSTPLLVELADDYSQEIAIAYAVVGLACATSRKTGAWIAAGALGSLAANSHESVLYLIIPLLVFVIIFHVQSDHPERRGRPILGRLALGVGSFVLVQIALSLIMAARFGWERSNWYFQEISIGKSTDLASGLARTWGVPFANTYLLITVTTFVVVGWIALAGIAAYAQRERSAMYVLLAPLAGGITLVALILMSHFVIGSGFVGWPFMLVMAVMPTVLLAWAALQLIWSRSHLPSWPVVTASVMAIALALVVARYLPERDLWLVLWITAAATAVGTAGLAIVLAGRSSPQRMLAALGVGAIAVVALLLPTSSFATTDGARNLYLSSLDGPAAKGRDVWSLARAFQRRALLASPTGVPIALFRPYDFPPAEGKWYRSLSQTLLGGQICLDCGPENIFPRITPSGIRLAKTLETLLILAPSRGAAYAAVRAAEDEGTGLSAVGPPEHITAGDLSIWLQPMRRAE